MKLIVGLGNPGKEYVGTRHNAGFEWLCHLAEEVNVSFKVEARFYGLCARVGRGDADVWLLKPQTYMNRSGQSVGALCQFHKILPEQVLVVHDELDLQPGIAKLKWGGGHGGHNGLKDIVAHLGTKDFWRLRIGIGHPGNRSEVVNYVLHPPRKEEASLIDEAIHQSLAVWPEISQGDCQAAMLKLHTKP